jgi:4-amino-4-deoxy-L-arabinose transferase-like glycosyltransferase
VRLALPVAAWAVSRDLSIFHAADDSYLLLARALLRGEGFSLDGVPEFLRTPGYSYLPPAGPVGGAVEPLTVLLQAIAGTITVGLVVALTRGLTSSRRASAVAGFAYAVEPLAVLYSSKLLSESLFAMCLLLAALLLHRSLRAKSWKTLVGGALALSLAAYVRPIGYFLPVVTAATWLAVGAVRRSVSRMLLARVAVFLAVAMSALGLWQMRNFRAAGYPRFSAVTDLALYAYHGAAVRAAEEGASFYDVRDRMLVEAESLRQSAPSQGAYYRSLGIIGEGLVTSRPWVFLSIYLKGVIRVGLDLVGSST